MLAQGAEWRGKSGRAFVALLLALFSGISTAAYAGYALETAWSSYVHCNPPPVGSDCRTTSFWALSPTWFLIACLAGVVVGLLTALVGWELHRRAFSVERGSYALFVLAIAGLVAYAGLGIGLVTGLLSAFLFGSLRTRRTGTPAEWSGVLPVGVAPVKTPPRPVIEKPAVAEWDGVSLPAVPPSVAPPAPASLPSADRLAAALARTRGSGTPSPVGHPRATVLLPPPPTGILPERPAHFGPPSAPPGPSSTALPPPHPVVAGRSAPASPSPAPTTPSPGRPGADPSERHPSRGAGSRPPPREFAVPPSAPPPLPGPAVRSTPARREDTGHHADRRVEPPRPTERDATDPPGGTPLPPAQPPTPAPAPTEPERPARTGGGRVRAWVCPSCRLMNAPWSSHCTRCHAAAPTG